MLFLTLGNFLLLGIQWLYETIRFQRYGQVMRRLLSSASVLVQRTRKAHTGDLTRTSLLNVSSDAAETVQFQDDYIQISSLEPEQEIDLSSWTSYTSYLDTHNAVRKPDQNICVLLEARRPKDLTKFVNKALKIPPAYRVHVLSHGCPIAWKTAEPFGIILHCSFAGLVILSDAFGQGRLTFDEALELIGLVTVKTKGHPQNLVHNDEELLSVRDDRPEYLDAPDSGSVTGATAQAPTGGGGVKSFQGTGSQRKELDKMLSSDAHFQQTDKQQVSSTNTVTDKVDDYNVYQRDSGYGTSKSSKGDNKAESSFTGNQSDSQTHSSMKPPNILVYCGIKDTARKFAEVKSSLETCINTDAYTVYQLNHDSILSVPWKKNTALLVISSCANLRKEVEDEIVNYVVRDGGHLLSFNSSVDSAFARKVEEEGLHGERLFTFNYNDTQNITSVCSRFYYHGYNKNTETVIPWSPEKSQNETHSETSDESDTISSNHKAVVVKIQPEGGGLVVLSQLLFERDPTEFARDQQSFAALKRSNTERLSVLRDLLTSLKINTTLGAPPALAPCHLLARKVALKNAFLESVKHRLKDTGILKSPKMDLKFLESRDETVPSSNLLPVLTKEKSDATLDYFEPDIYWRNLNTSKLGQIVFYTDVITTTMTVFDGLLFSIPDNVGPIAIAGRQTGGRGRGGNAWLSPAGCAMFTLPLKLSVDSELGQRVSFLQHIVSLAVVHSIVTLPGYEDLNIRLKWPNDIYFGRDIKLGGVLVTSTVMGSDIYATIGCGFNVSNSNPTICVNDVIRLFNTSHPELPDLSPLSTSQLLGRTVSTLENLLRDFEKKGHLAFSQLYYKHWLHSGAKVKIQMQETTEGEIVGLDEYGFLSVQMPTGELLSVQPDGNSFDMMHNLIHMKTRS